LYHFDLFLSHIKKNPAYQIYPKNNIFWAYLCPPSKIKELSTKTLNQNWSKCYPVQLFLKVNIFWEGRKIWQNLQNTIHLLPELLAFWILKKSGYAKNCVSGTVLMIQLTRYSPTCARIWMKWNPASENSVMRGLDLVDIA